MYHQDPDVSCAELATLDRIQYKIVLRAERKCRKLRTDQVPFAPDDVQRYGKEIRLWSMVIAKKSGKKGKYAIDCATRSQYLDFELYESFYRSNQDDAIIGVEKVQDE